MGSKEDAEGKAKAKSEAQSTILYNNADNINIGSLTMEPCYDTVNQQYMHLPYLTLNDKTSQNVASFDKGGSGQMLLTGIQTLISRFFDLAGIQQKVLVGF